MFALFAGENYYPAGGWEDLVGLFPSLEAAQAARDEHEHDWYQIVDLARAMVLESVY